MDKTLQQIANTIVANLINTEPIGLFNGKIGICLFLYKYARYSRCGVYEEIASELIDDVFKLLRPGMSPSIIDGLGGIGYGLVTLLKEQLVESDSDDNVLSDIDNSLLYNVKSVIEKELHSPVPLYSSGIYMLSRFHYNKASLEQIWMNNIIEQINDLMMDSVDNKQYNRFKLSFLNSILFVFLNLSKMIDLKSHNIECILRNILYLSMQSIQQNNYETIDILLLKQIIAQCPMTLEMDCLQVLELVKKVDDFTTNKIDIWYDNLWWSIIYNMPFVQGFSLEEIECYIENKVRESYFDEPIINSKLASVGLWLMINDCRKRM